MIPLVGRIPHARPTRRMNRCQPHLPHHPSNATESQIPTAVPQRQPHPSTAVVRMTFVDRLQIPVQRPLRLTVGCPGMVVRGARQIPSLALTRDRKTRLGIYHRLPLGSVHGTSLPCRKFRSMVHSPVLRCRESRSGDVPKSAVLLLRSNTAEPSSSNRFFPALDLRCLKCKPRRQLRQRLLPFTQLPTPPGI